MPSKKRKVDDTDPYRALFLSTVKRVLDLPPCAASLEELLRAATPSFTIGDPPSILKSKAASALRTLQLRLHPDKHENDPTATACFQKLDDFYMSCVARLTSRASISSSNKAGGSGLSRSSSCKYPKEHNICGSVKWPWLKLSRIFKGEQPTSEQTLARAIAAKYMNIHGNILHGKQTGLAFGIDEFRNSVSVEQAFNQQTGAKKLEGVDDIKRELTERGPVVSTSFILTQDFLSENGANGSFYANLTGKPHPVIIVGWKATSVGEIWHITGLGKEQWSVAVGQFNVEGNCLVLRDDLHTHWQRGPYYHQSLLPADWVTWSRISAYLTASELENLAKSMEVGFLTAALTKKSIEIVNNSKKYQSRTATLSEIKWNKELGKWQVDFSFV